MSTPIDHTGLSANLTCTAGTGPAQSLTITIVAKCVDETGSRQHDQRSWARNVHGVGRSICARYGVRGTSGY
jgi:hypothetical protein